MRATGVAGQVDRVGGRWVVLDLRLGQTPGQLVVGFPVAQVEAGFQVRVETVADVGGNALAVAAGMVLIAVVIGIGQGQVVVQVAQHLAGADLALHIAVAASFVAHL
ncbi:hypothetical protein D3C80_1110020 [compost metagenome]